MDEIEKTVETEEKPQPEAEPEKPEKPEAEGEEKPQEDAPAKEEGDGTATEAAATSEEQKPEEKHKRAGGWQRKIDRLERENAALIAKLTAPPSGQPPAATAPAGGTAEDKAAEYFRALARQELAAAKAEEQQMEAQAQFERRMREAQAAHPDFDEVILSADAPVSPALRQVILTSEHGPDIMYQLASNPAELARLSALPPLDAARAIGRLEAKLPSSTPAPKTKPSVRPPAPPTTVNGSPASTRRLEDLPMSEYKRAFRSGQR